MTGHGVIRRYRDHLPVTEDTPIISLNEGGTPLIDANQIVKEMGADFRLLVKHEGLNPTGSFKDRGMTLAVTKAVERGAQFRRQSPTGWLLTHTASIPHSRCHDARRRVRPMDGPMRASPRAPAEKRLHP